MSSSSSFRSKALKDEIISPDKAKEMLRQEIRLLSDEFFLALKHGHEKLAAASFSRLQEIAMSLMNKQPITLNIAPSQEEVELRGDRDDNSLTADSIRRLTEAIYRARISVIDPDSKRDDMLAVLCDRLDIEYRQMQERLDRLHKIVRAGSTESDVRIATTLDGHVHYPLACNGPQQPLAEDDEIVRCSCGELLRIKTHWRLFACPRCTVKWKRSTHFTNDRGFKWAMGGVKRV